MHFFFTVGVGVEVVCLVFRLEFTFPVADVVVSEALLLAIEVKDDLF